MANNAGIYNLNGVRELMVESGVVFQPLTVPVESDYPISEIKSLDQARWRDFPDYVSQTNPTERGVVFGAETLPPSVYLIDKSLSPDDLSTISFSTRLVHSLVGDQFDIKLMQFDHTVKSDIIVSDDLQRQYTFHDDNFRTSINTPYAVKLFADSAEILEFELSGLTVTLTSPVPIGTKLTLVSGLDEVPTITQLQQNIDYTVINNQIIHWNYDHAGWVPLGKYGFFIIQPKLPRYSQFAPLRVINNSSGEIVKPINRWDPAFGLHAGIVTQIDVATSTDPAVYTTDKTATKDPNHWTLPQVGTYWWDTTLNLYRPYNDQHIASFDQGTSSWGQLYETCENVVYQWVKSNKRPTLLIGSEVTPYSRILSKTRQFNDILSVAHDHMQSTFETVLPLNFTTGKYVSLYSRVDSSLKTRTAGGVTLGLPHIITVLTPYTFTLTTEAGELVEFDTLGDGEFRIADSDWSYYPSIEEPILYQTFYAYDNSSYPATDVSPTFTFTDPAIVRRLVDDNITVWLNGALTAYQFELDTLQLTLLDDFGGPAPSLAPQDIIKVMIPAPTPNITRSDGDLIDTNNAITVYVEDYPYSETSDGLTSTFFYWVRNYNNIPTTKSYDTSKVESELTTGGDAAFFAARNPSLSSTGEHYYDMITVKGLFDLNNPKPGTNSIAVDIDPNIRTQFNSNTNQKVSHDQWVLFRPKQKNRVLPFIWRKITQTVTGLGPTGVVTPSTSRSMADFVNSSTTRFGTGDDQVLIDTVTARLMLLDFLKTVSLEGIDKQPILEILKLPLNTSSDYEIAMSNMYKHCTPATVNDFTFLILNIALYQGYDLVDLIKTSYVSLDSSQILTVGGLS